jgi:hypothetical protein
MVEQQPRLKTRVAAEHESKRDDRDLQATKTQKTHRGRPGAFPEQTMMQTL